MNVCDEKGDGAHHCVLCIVLTKRVYGNRYLISFILSVESSTVLFAPFAFIF
jgi:hypothetical protein